MNGAREQILALVCGYEDWRDRRLGMFVAYVDESGKGDRRILVVGCLTAMPGQWIKFTREWLEVLHAPPRVESFHYREAAKRPWFDQKLPLLVDVINRNVERGDVLAVHVPEYERLFRNKVSKTYDSPNYQGYVSIMGQCLVELSRTASHKGKVDFVFDWMEDATFLELRQMWRRMKTHQHYKAIKKIVGSEPIRRHPTDVIPLQGADLLAGLMFRAAYKRGNAGIHLDGVTVRHRAFLWDATTLPGVMHGIDMAKFEHGILYEPDKFRAKRLGPARKLLLARGE